MSQASLQPNAPTASRTMRVVAWIVAPLMGIMIILPVAQTIARRVFHGEVPGASVYTLHLTVWIGFLGAILATVVGKHLSLSTVNLLPEGRIRKVAMVASAAVTAAVTSVLAFGALQMVLADRAQNAELPGGIPRWWAEVVLPLSLGVMAIYPIVRAPSGWKGRLVVILVCLAMVPMFWLGKSQATLVMGIGLGAVILAFLLGAPAFVAMGGAAMLLFYGQSTPIAAVPTSILELVHKETLPALPLLTVAGYVLAAGGASKRLVNSYRALLGWLPAGLGLMALVVCAFFTALTGASGVTILALGGLILPSLLEEGYPEGFSLGLVTAAGSLGLLFPPSLPVILYGVVAQADIKHLYIAGLVPGALIILLVAIYTTFVGLRHQRKRQPFVLREATRALWEAKWDGLLPLLIVVPLATGMATIVESAAIGALYSVIVEVVIFRNIHPWRDLPKVMAEAAALVGAVVVLMGLAYGLTSYLVDAQIPDALLEWTKQHLHSQWTFLLALNVILLVLGSVLEMYSAIVVLAPLVVPIGVAFGVDPVHMGVVFLANLELGFLFPPMGLNLFLSATRFGKPLPKLYRYALPFLIIMSVGVLLVTYVPAMTSGVLRVFGMVP